MNNLSQNERRVFVSQWRRYSRVRRAENNDYESLCLGHAPLSSICSMPEYIPLKNITISYPRKIAITRKTKRGTQLPSDSRAAKDAV